MNSLSPGAARLVLIALAIAMAGLVWAGVGMTDVPRRAGPSDLDTYERVVTALRAGQGYYPALHAALLDGGYGTTSPLNWRTPFFLTLLSWFPTLPLAQWALGALTAAGWALGVGFAYRRMETPGAVWAGIVLALSLVAIAAPRAELSFELCAGTLILISVSAYGLGWRWLGVAAGLLALFVRELAIIYVAVCLIDAMRRLDGREVIAWLVGLAAYGAYYAFHIQQVMAQLGPDDHAAAAGWLQFGGLVFLLRTAAFNGVLLVLPYWVAGIVLVLGLLGLARLPKTAWAVVLYLLLFLVYGRPENEYWGAMYAPMIALGIAFAPGVMRALVVRAWGRPLHQPMAGPRPPR